MTTAIQTTVHMDEWYAQQTDFVHVPMALYIAVDPVTGERACTIYSDDGRGNGVAILTFNMD